MKNYATIKAIKSRKQNKEEIHFDFVQKKLRLVSQATSTIKRFIERGVDDNLFSIFSKCSVIMSNKKSFKFEMT